MSKAKLIATSGICGAITVICLVLVGIPALKWVALILAVFASVSVAVPILADSKGLLYSLLTFFVGGVIGGFTGIANIVYVAPIITFCMPFAIVKTYGETVKVTARFNEGEKLEDPFGGESKTVVQVKVDGKQRLPRFARWIIYYALLEVSIALSMLAAYLLTPSVFEAIVANKFFIWVLVALQLIVPPYNMLMSGCLIAVKKILRKAVKPQ